MESLHKPPDSNVNVVTVFFDREKYRWTYPERTFESYSAVGIAVRDHIFGGVKEINSRGQFVGMPLVGKETLFQEDLDPGDVRIQGHACIMESLPRSIPIGVNQIQCEFGKAKILTIPF